MFKKFTVPLIAVCVLFFAACSKSGQENADTKATVAAGDTAYINNLFDTALKIKFFINDYMIKKNAWPDTLKVLAYPGMTFTATKTFDAQGKEKELITGILQEDKIYVRYEPTSFGKASNPMLSLSYTKDPSNDKASIQWINGVMSCAAYATSAEANAACKVLKSVPDHSNPLKNYYTVDDALTQEHKQAILAEVDDMLTDVAVQQAKISKRKRK